LTMASIFNFGVLFLIVWPQTLLASWIVRRFHFHSLFPFVFFLVISSAIVCIIDFAVIDLHRLLVYSVGTAYLLVSCSILWRISFRHEPAA
jgi:hypothetical protein